jgi:maltose alpha-D-glucosyltransferase/alpha-amylase
VLLAGDDVKIIDFEGEPTKSVDERRRKDIALRDVAGMLRSFDYAAAHVERTLKQGSQEGMERARTILRRFRTETAKALLSGYEQGRGRKLSPQDRALLKLFMLEKAAYEIRYEAANRPDWLIVPLRGLAALADEILQAAETEDA